MCSLRKCRHHVTSPVQSDHLDSKRCVKINLFLKKCHKLSYRVRVLLIKTINSPLAVSSLSSCFWFLWYRFWFISCFGLNRFYCLSSWSTCVRSSDSCRKTTFPLRKLNESENIWSNQLTNWFDKFNLLFVKSIVSLLVYVLNINFWSNLMRNTPSINSKCKSKAILS